VRLADRISLTPTASEVARFNAWFDEWCSESGLDDTLRADLKLCINEVLANLISHGFKSTKRPWIEIRLDLRPDRATARIIDNGAFFDLRRWQPPKDRDLATAAPGGFGIALTRERASKIRYARICGLNRLKIVCSKATP
jgi:anti-sigma regulatory factor (Ser/Thr protein kinase)